MTTEGALIKTVVLENGNIIWKKIDIKSYQKFHSPSIIRPYKVSLYNVVYLFDSFRSLKKT